LNNCGRAFNLLFGMGKYVLTLAVASVVVAADQVTKALVRASLVLHSSVPVLPVLNIVHYRNTGAAFGMLDTLSPAVRGLFFLLVLCAALVVVAYFMWKTPAQRTAVHVALALVLGGAVANSIDRLAYGYVTDFIDLHWFGDPRLHWAAFNLADSAITVGVVLLMLEALRKRGEVPG